MKKRRFFFLLFPTLLTVVSFVHAENRRNLAYNKFSVDFPFDGGAMVMYSRMWRINRVLDAGFFAGGGQIKRRFELTGFQAGDIDMETTALLLPFIGPKVTLNFNFIGVSLGYGGYWAQTDIEADWEGVGHLTGQTKGWGSGIYSPLLVLDFYNKRHDIVYGIGLGGFFGTSYKPLEARAPNAFISTDASPLDTLTLHVRMMWADGRRERRERRESLDDF